MSWRTKYVCGWRALMVLASMAISSASAVGADCGSQLNTSDSISQHWGKRHSVASGGRVLWFDDNQDVSLFDGTSVIPVQAAGNLGAIDDVVFALGSGAAPGQTIGAWRRGTDFGWVTVNGSAPKLVTATNPFNPNNPLNPEGVAIADGCVFMALQAFSGGQAVKHIYKVDPATGGTTFLTASHTGAVPGLSGRIRTSGCKAAWGFDVGDAVNPNVRLEFYDGSAVHELGPGTPSDLQVGRLIWIQRDAGNIEQIFLYDSNLPSPAPTVITARTDATGHIVFAQTDGRHVAWIESDANFQNRTLKLLGGIELSDAQTKPTNSPLNNEFPLQLRSGQVLWTTQSAQTLYYDGHSLQTVCGDGWLADGYLAQLVIPSQTDTEVFQRALTAPANDLSTPLLVRATPADGSTTLAWDHILGATSYHIYVAEAPNITPANYASLPFGRQITASSSPTLVGCLRSGRTYYAVVTAIINGADGPPSQEVSFMPRPPWAAGQGAPSAQFNAVAVDAANPGTLYAAWATLFNAGEVYKSTDNGASWTVLGGGIAGNDIRALAAGGGRVYAATRDDNIYRSTDGGDHWQLVAQSSDPNLGEQNKSLAIDPSSPNTVFAADLSLPSKAPGESYVVRSTDGGDTWKHLPDSPGIGDEVHAYAMVVKSGSLLAGGSGTPNLAKLNNAGTTTLGTDWSNIHLPPSSFVYSLAVAPNGTTLYAGTLNNLYKSVNGGANWAAATTGLPAGVAVRGLAIDPGTSTRVIAGTDAGVYVSEDEGQNWVPLGVGMTDPSVAVQALAITPARYLVAATADGLWRYLLDVPPAAQPSGSDSDGDSVPDCVDSCPGDPNKILPGVCGCGVADTDTDADGTPDCTDSCPNDVLKVAPGVCGCGMADTDGDADGTPDCHDGCPTDPNKIKRGVCDCGVADVDSDGDGTLDCNDLCPNNAAKVVPGLCGCSVAETDSDKDGKLDCQDGCPNDAGKTVGGQCGCGVPDTDTDGDGTADCNDVCPNDARKTAAGTCGCGIVETDSNGNGTPDCIEGCPGGSGKTSPGQCGCGTPDTDSDGDGVADCNDKCPNDAAKTAPGACGCGAADTDSDGDLVPDCHDNCKNTPNPDQADANQDGVGDACASTSGNGTGGNSSGSNGNTNGNGTTDTGGGTTTGGGSDSSSSTPSESDTSAAPVPARRPGICGGSVASAAPMMLLCLAMMRMRRRRW